MKSLQTDRDRSDLGAATEAVARHRHPSPQPVYERRLSRPERLARAIREHKLEAATVAALVVVLALGVVGTSVGMVRASRQRDAALAAQADAERLRRLAEDRQREAGSVNEFLEAVLASANPWGTERGSEVSVEQMLDVASSKLDAGSMRGQTEAEARVRTTLGQAYGGLSLYPKAERHLRKALEALQQLHRREDHPDVARAMAALANILTALDAPNFPEAEQLATAALEMRRRIYGPDHREVADSLDTLSAVCRLHRDFYTAERRVAEALEMRRRLPPGPTSKIDLARTLTNRAILLWRKGELTQTIQDLREAAGYYAGELPADHLVLGGVEYRLAIALDSAGKRDEAVEHYRRCLDIRRRHRAEGLDEIADPVRRLALGLRDTGKYESAEQVLLDREERLRQRGGGPADQRTELYGLLVGLYHAWDKPERVSAWGERFQKLLGEEIAARTAEANRKPSQARPLFDRAKLRARAGQFRQAVEDYARGLVIDPSDHWPWFYQGCVLAYLGDEAAYKKHCAQMLERFGSRAEGPVLDCTAKTCSLVPGAGDPERLNQIANRVWVLGGKDERNAPWFRLLRGLTEYRAGNPDRAVEWLTTAATPELQHRTATAELLLANVPTEAQPPAGGQGCTGPRRKADRPLQPPPRRRRPRRGRRRKLAHLSGASARGAGRRREVAARRLLWVRGLGLGFEFEHHHRRRLRRLLRRQVE